MKKRTLVSGGVRGTLPWMAPELLTSDKESTVTEKVRDMILRINQYLYGSNINIFSSVGFKKVDVYSFGFVMWELLTGEEPLANLSSKEVLGMLYEMTLEFFSKFLS